MTRLQETFLLYSSIIFFIQALIFLAFYIVMNITERKALIRHKKIKKYCFNKRKQEKENWEIAYKLLSQKDESQPPE